MRINCLTTPEMQGASARSNLNRRYRRAWDKGLKTTYYLRTLQASNIEKSTIDVKKAPTVSSNIHRFPAPSP